ncbi:MAG: HD domain-containing protein [Acetatifactor sp.]
MLPTREEAERLLREAEQCNPGPWGNHSRVVAHCAKKIAESCGDMDAEKAYLLGLLHDIGRKFGVRHLGHVSDGYTYMSELGYDEVAKICLTHSFHNQTLEDYIGRFDTSDEELKLIKTTLAEVTMDDYDRLIQLCDSLAGSEGVLFMEERMEDVRRRYGAYSKAKWDANLRLKEYFQEKAGKDIYEVVEKETFRPNEEWCDYGLKNDAFSDHK